jgi:hypothetical protein
MIAGGKSNVGPADFRARQSCPSGEVMTQQIAIDQTDAAVAGALPHTAQQEISHSTLLYWWPAWAFGFVLPLLNAGQEKFLAAALGAKPSSALGLNERTEIVERERQRLAAELEAANARTELAERERQRLAAELEAAQAREQAVKEMAEVAREREQAVLETAEAARVRELAANAMAEGSRRVARRTLAGLAAALLLALIAFATGIYKSWELAQLKGHQGSGNAVAMTPDGAHIVSGPDDMRATTTRTGGPRMRPGIAVHVR